MLRLEINNRTKFAAPRKDILNALNSAEKKMRLKKSRIVSLAFVSPAVIKKLNGIYRGKNKVTDVLSFAGEEDFGEIIICPARARRQAAEFGHSYKKEVVKLALHGYLHLLGFDHEKKDEAKIMEGTEEDILKYD